jgi:adenylate kinase
MDAEIETIKKWLGKGSINFFGRPFSGKDTQCLEFADMFGGELISGGDILRSHNDSEIIKQTLASGGIIPTDFYLSSVLPYLSKPEFTNSPLILSSVGRSKGEEVTIIDATSKSGHPLKAVILLNISEEEVWRRFNESKIENDRGNRSDDRVEALTYRLKEFNDKTIPVIDFYKSQKMLIEVNGMERRLEVTSDILKSLLKLVNLTIEHT